LKKRKEALSVVALLLLLMTSMSCLVRGDAEDDVVGVKAGDWVEYRVMHGGTGNQAWMGLFAFDVKTIMVEVVNVTDGTVWLRETWYKTDGSILHNRTHSAQSGIRYLIPANSTPGDCIDTIPMEVSINQWEYVDLTLNDTVPRSYGGVTREANRLMYSQLKHDGLVDLWANWTLEQYWDKPTGFLLETTYQMYFIDNPNDWSGIKMEIADTNMWEMEKPPQQSFLWLAAIPIGVVIIAAVTIKLRNNRKKNEDDKQ